MLQNFFKESVNTNKYYLFLAFTLFLTCCAALLYIMWLYLDNNSLFERVVPDGLYYYNVPMDPVLRSRCWPSGVPQSITCGAVVGTMVGTFIALTKLGVNPRFRLLGALGAGGVSTGQVIYNSAIENSVGFNRLMFSLTEYKKTGNWPSLDQMLRSNSYSEEAVNSNVTKALEQAAAQLQDKIRSMLRSIEEVTKLMLRLRSSNGKGGDGSSSSSSSSSLVSNLNNSGSDLTDGANIITNFMDSILNHFFSIFKPSPVSGYLDDLIGQQIVLQFVVLLSAVSLFLLIIAYIINNLLLLNKDFIVKHLGKNKIIIFYLKYQVISIKISLFVLPLFILLGLITLIQSSYYIITHPIPYELLDVNLHMYIDKK